MTNRAEAVGPAPHADRDRSPAGLQARVVSELDAVLELFDATMIPLRFAERARDARLDGATVARRRSRWALHADLMAGLADPGAGAADRRVIAALLDVTPCLERIESQIASLGCPEAELAGAGPAAAGIRAGLERLARLARAQLADARSALAIRDPGVAAQLPRRAALIDAVSLQIARSPAIAGPDPDARRLTAAVVVVANALEQISEDAVEIAEQVVAVTEGLFQELAAGL